jgi:hypothetical protein
MMAESAYPTPQQQREFLKLNTQLQAAQAERDALREALDLARRDLARLGGAGEARQAAAALRASLVGRPMGSIVIEDRDFESLPLSYAGTPSEGDE